MNSPKAKARLKNSFKIMTFSNISTKINMMNGKVIKDMGLAI